MCPGGSFMAIKHPFWGFVQIFVQITIMYVIIVVPMVLNSNLQVPIAETLSFFFFGCVSHPLGTFRAKNTPKMTIFNKKAHFGCIYFD